MIKIYNRIKKFQDENNIEYGCNPFKICKNNRWQTLSYLDFGIDLFRLLKISKDGFSVLNEGEYYIFYNPLSGNEGRVNFTIAHEIGHILLNHHLTSDKKILMYGESTHLENQANIVARNILMPANITRELFEVKSVHELSDFFNVSHEMARVRLKQLKKDLFYLNRMLEDL